MLENKLNLKLILILLIPLLIFIVTIWLYFNNNFDVLNKKWGERFVKKQIVFDKNRVLLPILKEIEIVKEMSHHLDIINMVHYENNQNIRKKGFGALEQYRLKLREKNYFIAIAKSRHYYFHDELIPGDFMLPRYTLLFDNASDQWFDTTMDIGGEFHVNVNNDRILGTQKVWINYLLKDHNKTIGIIGTGIDLTKFIKESVGLEQEGVRNLFINKDLAIQLERNIKLIDYSSLTKNGKSNRSIRTLLKDKNDIDYVKKMMQELEISKDDTEVKVFYISFEGKKQLVGLAYLKELGWFSLSVVDFTMVKIMVWSSAFLIGSIYLSILWNYLLRKKVREEVSKNIKKEKLLQQISKQSEIGNMVANIAHQWLMPLNQLNMITIATIATLKAGKTIGVDEHIRRLEEMENSIKFMSQTMRIFLDFYKVSQVSSRFNIYESIREVLVIHQMAILQKNISIDVTGDMSIDLEGIKNEWMQVWLNLINNSLNIFSKREIRNPMIKIAIFSNKIVFSDNGGGMDLTRETNGLGLVMCKTILKKYNAFPYLENTLQGLSVQIVFKS